MKRVLAVYCTAQRNGGLWLMKRVLAIYCTAQSTGVVCWISMALKLAELPNALMGCCLFFDFFRILGIILRVFKFILGPL